MDPQQPGQFPPDGIPQQIQGQARQPRPGEPGYSRTFTSSVQTTQTPGQEPKKPSKVLVAFITVVVIIGAVVAGVFITQCRAQMHADKYGADAPYTITGTVEKAHKNTSGKSNSYSTVIKADQELPDGSHEFVSHESIDHTYAKKFVGQRVEVVIDTDGHIDKIKALE